MITYKQTLGLDENPEAKRIRQTVFVEEQGFQNEFDETDPIARHVVAWEDGRPIATGRVFPKDDTKDTWTIGRVAVLPPYRGKGIGALIVRRLEQIAQDCGAREWTLSAQLRAKGFYEALGYTAHGEIYQDEFCPHISMCKRADDVTN